MSEPNPCFYVPLGAAGLAVTVLLILGAYNLGKRRRPWLMEGNS